MTEASPSAGRLLVATPALSDPNFRRTVVLLLDHDGSGSLGVVLNRPTPVEVGEVLPAWAHYAGEPAVVFRGGPVALDAALGVALAPSRAAAPAEADPADGLPAATGEADGGDGPLGWRRVLGAIGLVDLEAPPELLADELGSLRIFAGYAGWGAGQLEKELAEGAWYVVDAEPGDVSSPGPEGLWRAVLRRQRSEIALVATYPDDPSLN